MKLYSPVLQLATLIALTKSKAATAAVDIGPRCVDTQCLSQTDPRHECITHYCLDGRCVDQWLSGDGGPMRREEMDGSDDCPFPCDTNEECIESAFNLNPNDCMRHWCEDGGCMSEYDEGCGDTPSPVQSPSPNVQSPSPNVQSPSPNYDTPGPSTPTVDPPSEPCGQFKSCSINPDPHYSIWSGGYYDFQGGCDQIAIDNSILQVQIRTRPRTFYSTITQLVVHMKATDEIFRATMDGTSAGIVSHNITGTGIATYAGASNQHTITLGNTNPASYIRIYMNTYGLSMTAYGCGTYFAGSEGMCGSWDAGGVREENGAPYNLVPLYGSIQNNLAQSWKVDGTENLLEPASSICDNSPLCGAPPTHAFTCTAIDRRLQDAVGACERTCADIDIPQFREQCEDDVELTQDDTWACTSEYVNAVVAGPDDPNYWCTVLSMTDQDLFDLAKLGPLGDHCEVTDNGVAGCNYYVVGRDGGLPGDSGCVDEDGVSCIYQDTQYDFLNQEERDSMCTASHVANAAAQLRWGIENGHCMDDPDYFSPCPSDWEIIYNNDNLIVDFSLDSDNEITLDYDISDREYELEVYADCDAETPADILTMASVLTLPKDNFHEKLIIAYDVDKAAIADSPLWNEAASELQFCQRVSLLSPDTDALPGMSVVTENTDVAIVLNLTVGFEFDNDVDGRANTVGGGEANFDGFVDAYKCNSDGGFDPDPSPLLPNDQLFVCVKSLSTDVEINLIESMAVTQDTTGTELDVALNGAIRNPSMTEWRYESAYNGWLVSTRVPTELPDDKEFLFESGESITVYGTVKLELFSANGRKLQLVADNVNKPDKGEQEASYELKVQLAQDDEMEKIGLTSAAYFKRMWLVSTTTVIALSFAML